MLRASVFNGLVIIAAIQDIRNTVIASAVNFTLDPALFAGKTSWVLELFDIWQDIWKSFSVSVENVAELKLIYNNVCPVLY